MPDWLAQTTGMSQGSAQLLAVVLAMLIIAVLIAVCIPLLKRLARTSYKGSRSRQPRLAIMDTTDIDARRRLLLVRRDNVEHLILIGGANDLVVEQGIVRGVPVTPHPRGSSFASNMQSGVYPASYDSEAQPAEPVTPSPQPDWGEEPKQKMAAPNPAPAVKMEPNAAIEPIAPAQATPTETRAAAYAKAPHEKTTPLMPAARPIRPAPPVSPVTKPAALQTPTIGGARSAQKIAARPITARPPVSRSLSSPRTKPATPAPATITTHKPADVTAPIVETPKAEPPAPVKPIPKAALKPPMNGPAAHAASAFMRPRVAPKPAAPKGPKEEDLKPALVTGVSAKPEPTPADKKEDKGPTTESPASTSNPAKPQDSAPKVEVAPKAAHEKKQGKASKKAPKVASEGMEKEMADLLDDIEANTK
ncbi:flagellar biosynthetic protein FliO [Pseudovibrio sp. Tun.PSC04-5.I4]|uniref:flagellar biosynthetic protein FliO n=1 Tax=Pseudovibrio sp. Tun.PSC04-5.I4 TaxID=1798213 RepID=UPI0008820C5E|nr:flagellar biosynthetic protein FliO [Pseudovibrio sp. Tun.PSC04-5.I4]SDR37146.1 Flagellar biosynthesis protein, FliO [Pseudovibrio sp. Tun.PSC04-5.I4]